MDLVLGIDSAWPAAAPEGTRIILGYAGRYGEASNVWTPEQIDAARAQAWFGLIWTPQQGEPLFDAAGEAQAFATVLKAMGYPSDAPVFLDMEEGTRELPGAISAADVWRSQMRAHGFANPFIYGYEWRASWLEPAGNVPPFPGYLPEGCMGWQYADAGPVDLSVFDGDLPWWGKTVAPPPAPKPKPKPAPLDPLEVTMVFVVTTGEKAGSIGHEVTPGEHYVLDGGYRMQAVGPAEVTFWTKKLGDPDELSCAGVARWQHT